MADFTPLSIAGGRIFPDTPSGIYSNTWIETLKNDCPSCPWFNDKRPLIGEDPLYQLFPSGDYSKLQRPANESQLNLFIDPAIKKESFGNMPHWFASSLFSHRRGMSLGPAATMRNSYLSIGHIHNWFGQSDRKMSFRKFYGAYNFSLGSILAARRNETPYERATHFDRVLVLDPKIDLSRLRDWNEFSSMIMGLKQLARLSHRVLVMPEVPCVAQWLHEKQWLQKYKSICMAPTFFQDHGFQILSVIYPVDKESGELVGGWSRRRMAEEAKDTNFLKPEVQAWWSSQKYMAQVVAAVSPACTHRHAITTPDFHHWLRNSEPGKRASSKPSDSNSAFRVDPSQQDLMLKPPVEVDKAPIGLGGTVEPLPDNGWSWYDRQSAVSARDAIREMFRLRAEPVVFLSHPVMLVPGEGGEEIGVDIDTGVTRKVQDPNSLLHTINEMITLGLPNCRAIRPTFHHKEQEGTVDLNHGIPSTISSSGMLVKRP